MDGQRLDCNRVGILERRKMKVKYEDIRRDMLANCLRYLRFAFNNVNEVSEEFIKKIARNEVENFMEFYEITGVRPSAMMVDMIIDMQTHLDYLKEQRGKTNE